MGEKNKLKKQKDKKKKKNKEQLIFLREQGIAQAKQLNLMSNVFISVALNDIPACQHVLRIITGIRDLVVKEVRAQYYIAKITSHDAVLDILAEDGNGQLYNIEIQRADTIDHARRTRFYGSMIDSEFLQKGKSYHEMPEVRLIYISETDIWKQGKTVYEVEKSFNGTNIPYDDGKHVTYVNAAVDDNSEIAKLMNYFKTADPMDMSQGDLSKRVHYLKCEEGGYDIMCEVSDKIMEIGKEMGKIEGLYQGRKEGRRKGRREGRREGKIEGKIEGIIEGKLEQAKVTSVYLAGMGMAVEKIAEAVNSDVEVVKKWIAGENKLVG